MKRVCKIELNAKTDSSEEDNISLFDISSTSSEKEKERSNSEEKLSDSDTLISTPASSEYVPKRRRLLMEHSRKRGHSSSSLPSEDLLLPESVGTIITNHMASTDSRTAMSSTPNSLSHTLSSIPPLLQLPQFSPFRDTGTHVVSLSLNPNLSPPHTTLTSTVSSESTETHEPLLGTSPYSSTET
jgi:hypothetical protein